MAGPKESELGGIGVLRWRCAHVTVPKACAAPNFSGKRR
jgi:hypothetical protein